MYFDFDLISKILLGALPSGILTAIITNRKSKKDLCLKVYDRWNGSLLYQNRNDVLKQLKAFFDKPPALGGEWSDRKIKLSELHYLSKPSPNYQPQCMSEDFVEKFIHIMIFFADLNKLMKSGLIDIKLSQTLFKDTVIPWYKYLDKLEFDYIENIEYGFAISEVNSLKEKLSNPFLNEVSVMHMNYVFLEQKLAKSRTSAENKNNSTT